MSQEYVSQVTHTEQIGELMGALAKAQSKIENALKSKKNPFYKSSYADLASVWDVCKEPLSSNGLAVVQTVEGNQDDMFLVTILGHSSSQWIKSKIPLILTKKDPQALGSCITYARRYALSAMVGVCADEDDDGESAMARNQTNQQKKEKAKIDDLTQEQINKYINAKCLDFGVTSEVFLDFFENIRKTYHFTYKTCVEELDKNPEYTAQVFDKWFNSN